MFEPDFESGIEERELGDDLKVGEKFIEEIYEEIQDQQTHKVSDVEPKPSKSKTN